MGAGEVVFPSREFAEKLCVEINASEAYKRYARGWKWPILFKLLTPPPGSKNLPGFILDLYEGECRGYEWFDDAVQAMADYVLSAPYEVWLEVIEGRLHPIRAILQRRIKLERGSYTVLARYSQAATEIVRAAQRVMQGKG